MPKNWMRHTQKTHIGFWTADDHPDHINLGELIGAARVTKAILTPATKLIRSLSKAFHVNLLGDNQVAVTYINNQGGKTVELSREAKKLHDWATEHFKPSTLVITATYTEGDKMIQLGPDELSRLGRLGEEVKLNPRIFYTLQETLRFTPKVDLFANHLNKQVHRYYSAHHDLNSQGTNAFAQTWMENSYAFPPLKMMPAFLQKLQQETATVLTLVPLTPSAKWWPLLLRMVSSDPIYVAQGPATFQTPNKYLQPTKQWSQWSWIGMLLSSSDSKRRKAWAGTTRRKWLRNSGKRLPPMGISQHGEPFMMTMSETMVKNRLNDLSLSSALKRG
mmetsp:Transcript_13880/g.19274  ORF Transcript_13880/g.19274 Transcript_13880/m.19274 type:complete len:333 (+) Transcript_13880:445-1443(+)